MLYKSETEFISVLNPESKLPGETQSVPFITAVTQYLTTAAQGRKTFFCFLKVQSIMARRCRQQELAVVAYAVRREQ